MVKREAIRKAVTEFSPVLRPLKGRVLYLGTPHTETSIYNEEEARGCRVQIFPIKYPNSQSRNIVGRLYISYSSPHLLGFLLLLSMNGVLRDRQSQ